MLTLKKYQKDTLEILRFFLEAAHLGDHTAAFAQHRTESAQRASSRDYRALDALAQVAPTLVQTVVPRLVPLHVLTAVMRQLLSDKVPVADLRRILEGLPRLRGTT